MTDFTYRTRVLPVEDRHRSLETIWRHCDVRDLKVVLQGSAHAARIRLLPQQLTFLSTPVVGHSRSMSVSTL